MNRFVNGHKFAVAISLLPPGGKDHPFVEVEMSGPEPVFRPGVGKLDTGASRTMLNAETAAALGHVLDWSNRADQRKAQSASGHTIHYYERRVFVRVAAKDGPGISFPLVGAFSNEVERNLFGVDWLRHMCVAVDEAAVHLLRD
jgi:hypothetical protein